MYCITRIITPFKKRVDQILKAQRITKKAWESRVKVIPMAQRLVQPDILNIIADCVLRVKRCKIEYIALSSYIKECREISPQTLLRYKDNWYVDAWCHLRGGLRTFALSRIESAVILKLKSKLIKRSVLDGYYSSSYGIFCGPPKSTAVILFTGVAAREVASEEWHPAQKNEWINDDTLKVMIPYGDDTELIMDIMRWGDGAEIIKPRSLRKKIAKKFDICSKKYASVT